MINCYETVGEQGAGITLSNGNSVYKCAVKSNTSDKYSDCKSDNKNNTP